MPSDPPPTDDRARDAWLSEMWRPCRELSREERARKRQDDWEARQIASLARPQASTLRPQEVA